MELSEDLKSKLIETFHHKKVKTTRKIVHALFDAKIINIIHMNHETFYVGDLRDYEPRIRCSNQNVNKEIRKYCPGIVQDAMYMIAENSNGVIVFWIFISHIEKKRNSRGCIGSRIYECSLAVYECEISIENAGKYLPYTVE